MAKKKTKKRQAVSKKFIPQTNIFADEIYLPNHSGEHTAGTTTTPINGNHIANKDYVDAQIAGENHWDDDGTNLKPFIAGRNVLTTGNVQGVTQAEFNTLTDNSIANALHRHSELVASDGTPDPALSVDASGNVGIGTTSPDYDLEVVGSFRADAFKTDEVTAHTVFVGDDAGGTGTFSVAVGEHAGQSNSETVKQPQVCLQVNQTQETVKQP